ncbi:acetolactate synthase [Basidiobolus meristosporus CBS 931.73]|uniref:Acetolactate synthase n=1 Tax=Basidiobolus meristosporus CBS 931.73 TaxID=1314790 RepID=A0A1Y1YPH1_9FUNG|nr:acetolactate synthase [Basidiobolus meristosporus CBS 931.73]|eukprot:ORX99927.1 acetolactate synthase [Basidiobolus meristosporus CBS 931.73]
MLFRSLAVTTRQKGIQALCFYSSSSSSSSKRQPRSKKLPPLPTIPTLTPEEAVTNIIYNTPTPPSDPPTRHTLNCLVQNEPGVLSRVSGILAARNFNIDSLVVAKTEVRDLSRMTIVLRGQNQNIEQAKKQLEDLVPVWAVLDYSNTRIVERELLLVKVSIFGPDHEQAIFEDDTHSHTDMTPGDILLTTHKHLQAIQELTKLFQGQIVDVSNESVIVQLCAKNSRIDAFMKLLKPFGILEAARSGIMAMPRALHLHPEEETEVVEEATKVDATLLPPG